MSIEIGVSKFVKKMYAYQKKNDIKHKCLTNTQYLHDSMKISGVHVKAKAVISFHRKGKDTIITNHILVQLPDGTMLDPSYDIGSENVKYYETIESASNLLNEMNEELTKREFVKLFIRFIEYAEKINSGEIVITDKDYYNNLADFMENK